MTTDEQGKYLEIALEAVGEAGKYLKEKFGDRKGKQEKEKGHWGITEDKEANLIYERIFKNKTPGLGLYTEEGERDLSRELYWCVDPIEGTTNFAGGIPFFATQTALVRKGKPIVAVISAPMFGDTYSAVIGVGAYCNGKKIQVGNEKLKDGVVWIDKGKDSSYVGKLIVGFSEKVRTLRWMGALGLNMTYVARGGVDLFVNKGSELYDYMPGVLLVREAGGRVVNFSGQEWTSGDREVIAGNEEIVKEGLRVIANIGE